MFIGNSSEKGIVQVLSNDYATRYAIFFRMLQVFAFCSTEFIRRLFCKTTYVMSFKQDEI